MVTKKNFIKLEVSKPSVDIIDKSIEFNKNIKSKSIFELTKITSRIDHMNSATNTICSLKAIENALDVKVTPKTKILRDIIIMAEITLSHNHFILTKIMPKINNIKNYYDYVKKYRREYLRIQKVSMNLIEFLEIITKRYPHPISTVIGGFTTFPDTDQRLHLINLLKEIKPEIERITDNIIKNVNHKFDIDTNLVSLWELDNLPLSHGEVIVNDNKETILKYFKKSIDKKNIVGPIARINNNNKLLSFSAEKVVKKNNIKFPINNIYSNILCMCIEMLHFNETSLELLSKYDFEDETLPKYKIKKSFGYAAIESAKGLIYHEYNIDNMGIITNSKIISNISQNRDSLHDSVNKLPLDFDTKTRKELLEEIEFLIDCYYL